MMLWCGLIMTYDNKGRYIVGKDRGIGNKIENPKIFSNYKDAWNYMETLHEIERLNHKEE